MKVFKHIAYKETTIEWVEKVVIEGVRKVKVEGEEKETLVKEVVEIPRSTASHSIQYHWLSEEINPLKSNPYPERTDVLFKTELASEADARFYVKRKQSSAARERSKALKDELTILRTKPTLTLPEMKQAFDKLFDLMEK